MKLLLSVGAIALTLTFSAYADPPNHVAMFPDFYKCFDLLRFESLQIDPQNNSVLINTRDPNQMDLLHRYFEVVGWLRGFFTAMNNFGLTADRNVTKDTTHKEWMPWIHSYCRSHPTENLEGAAIELAKALSSKTP
jgi:hypothetical protein